MGSVVRIGYSTPSHPFLNGSQIGYGIIERTPIHMQHTGAYGDWVIVRTRITFYGDDPLEA